MIEPSWENLVGTGLTGAVVVWMAKAFIDKALDQLEEVSRRISFISEKLIAIEIKIEQIEDHAHLLQEHDRKITTMEASHNGNSKRSAKSSLAARPGCGT